MQLLEVNGQLTMSSLELVEYINAERGDGVAQLRHSDFLEKVVNVLGDEYSGNFRSTYTASNGKENPCYNFPKREACLMAMSYSYDIQAKIFDRWQELENVVAAPVKVELPPMTISEKYEQLLTAQRMVQDESLKATFPLIWQQISDGTQNDVAAMFGSQKRIQSTDATPLDVMEIAKRNGIDIPANRKSVVGKHVKAKSSVPPVVIERVINGSVRTANAYTNHAEIVSIIKKYLGWITE